MADGIHERFIGHDEKHHRIFGGVLVAMVIPERDDKGIAFFPLVALIADVGDAAAALHMVDRRAGVPMTFGLFAGAEHLNLAGHGG